ncbi:MAG: helix-turn-helix domain-containing protein [Pseudomonadota bacterium]|nr:helix-turn-helix domain-containing protein [Pseudomonadota bacterium]
MSEHDLLPSGQADPAGAASGSTFNPTAPGLEPTAGAWLRAAREAQGVDIAALAASLKVPVDKLEALEQDRFDLLLDVVFVRALASGVCRLLKLDPNPVLQRLPALNAAKVTSQNRGINEPFRSRSGSGSSLRGQISKPVILVGLALLLGAVVLVFLPVIQQKTAGKLAGQEVSSASMPSTVQETLNNAAPAVSASPAGEPHLPYAGAAPPSSALPASVPASAPAAVGLPATAANAGDANAASLVTFSARQSSWVKVNDAKGVLVLNRTLQAGESVSVSGTPPLSAVVGRADAVQVQVRGQALDLTASTKNNIARFEVK